MARDWPAEQVKKEGLVRTIKLKGDDMCGLASLQNASLVLLVEIAIFRESVWMRDQRTESQLYSTDTARDR